jgi:hypothetical protein
MEGCPADNVIMLYMALSSVFFLSLFLLYKATKRVIKWGKVQEIADYRNKMKDDDFHNLQSELFGASVVPELSIDNSKRETQFGTISRSIPHGS